MTKPSLQDGIDRAGSPVRLLWKPNAAPWAPPVVKPEYVGWREEQAAWARGVAFSDLSHHMSDLFMEGPDATRLLAAVSANDYESFAIGQAKQFVPVTQQGHLITDGILLREGPEKYVLSGVPAAQNWVRYHAEKGGYDVSTVVDPDSSIRKGDPILFRYQVQGPRALEMVERAFGGPLPKTRFFHSVEVSLAGARFRALRHGMAGQPGYEFVGAWRDAATVKEALLTAGKAIGIVHVGALAYATNGVESGWIPTPTAGIYTAPELADYRRWLSLFSFEGQKPLHGTFYSENIEDYYVSPYELGYGKSVALDHEFIGRAALASAKQERMRAKVTLIVEPQDVREHLGAQPEYYLSYGRFRVEHGASLVGLTFYTAFIHPLGKLLSLALVDRRHATPGTSLTVLWGEHPGASAAPGAHDFKTLRVTVAPAPFSEYARTHYRSDA